MMNRENRKLKNNPRLACSAVCPVGRDDRTVAYCGHPRSILKSKNLSDTHVIT